MFSLEKLRPLGILQSYVEACWSEQKVGGVGKSNIAKVIDGLSLVTGEMKKYQ